MKTIIYALLAALLFSTVSFAGLENIYVEQYVHDGTEVGGPGAGFITYRIFAQTSNSNEQVVGVIGDDSTCNVGVSTTTSFWNYTGPLSGGLTPNNHILIEDISEGIQYDSYVTIGLSGTNTLGVPLTVNSEGNIPTTSSDNTVYTASDSGSWTEPFLTGGNIIIDGFVGGGWFVEPGSELSLPIGTDNSVMLGNFTTDGAFTFYLSVYVQIGSDDYPTAYTHCNDFGLYQTFNNQCTDELACNYNPEATEDNGSCKYISESCNDLNPFSINDAYSESCECEGQLYGCTDETACNYNIEADFDNGSCFYVSDSCNDLDTNTTNDIVDENCECIGQITGCMDSEACNYNDQAIFDNGTCAFPGDECFLNYNGEVNLECDCDYSLNGVVFMDDDYDQSADFEEEKLPFQTIVIEELDLIQITNTDGRFSFEDIPEGTYQVIVSYTGDWSTYTTPTSYSVSIPQLINNPIEFGVTNEEEPPPSACADFYPSGAGVPCNDELNFNICWRNMSPYPISGVVEVQMDDLMSLNYTNPTHDSIVGQSVFWSYEDLGSWVMRFDDIVMYTPDETHFGEYVTNTVIIHAWDEGELIPITERTVSREVTCAYDPNDITGIPEGYTDDHLVLPDTRMEYLIRFQNTGNAPAGQVMVVDTLDVDMDPSTFQLVANSHDVLTTIHPSGRVEFLFENINLPDSTENEPESHGLVSFKIDFRDDVSIGEEINSTAYIFFDNNPAVITNTTWHTIHECGGEADFEASATEICRGETVTFTGTTSLVEEHTWNVDAAPSGAESAYSSEFTEAGDYIIQLVAENPLCNASTMQMLTVYDLPEAEITESGAILTSNEGDSYQWYLNGEAIDSATDQTYEALGDGNYTVEVTNENGCSTLSSSVMIVNIEELTALKIELFPNPMDHNSTLTFDTTREKTIRLTDPQGKLIRTWSRITDQTVEIERGTLTAGKYYITVEEEGKSSTIALVVR